MMLKFELSNIFKNLYRAFTLAEVLIILGIIGVITAITIPNLISKYQKNTVETKVTKFYSTINQAFKLSIEENGDFTSTVEKNKHLNYNEMVDWLKIYLFPYLQVSSYESCSSISGHSPDGVCVTLRDGGILWISIDNNGGDIVYYANGKRDVNPRNNFQFQFSKYKNDNTVTKNSETYIEPYIFNWDGTKEQLKSGNIWACKPNCTNCGYCTKLLQLNSWKFPNDYPW